MKSVTWSTVGSVSPVFFHHVSLFCLARAIWVVKFDCSIHFLLTYSHKSSDWDASTSPRQLVQVAIVVPKRLNIIEPRRQNGGWYRGMEPTGHPWHQFQRPGGYNRDVGRNETEVPEHHAGEIMAIVADLEQQEGEPQPRAQEKC